ncbi:RNase P modulator RnpM [Listeria aquatica]|uniref:YlxR family protein n=1 Tax=Listeria aquatica TaxID=1494960 RepID=A0A841ZPM9_9LIST|nr:YlxR family RNase P modulator [Listeria aquatica]MBC1521125.1 YlxR family protein [Listeria aquatica]
MRSKKIPLRKCIVTGERLPKQDLLRIAYSKEGELTIDPTGKAPGRGFYIKKDVDVAKRTKEKNTLFHQLKMKEQEGFYDELIAYVESLEDENHG